MNINLNDKRLINAWYQLQLHLALKENKLKEQKKQLTSNPSL